MDELESPVASLIVGMVLLLSAALWARLRKSLRRGRPLIAYEPRRPVPWNVLAPIVMLAPLIASLQAARTTSPPPIPPPELTLSVAAQAASASGAPPATAIAGATASEAARTTSTARSITGALWMQSLISLVMGLGCYAMLAVAFGATAADLGLPTSWRQLRYDSYLGAAVWLASMAPTYLLMFVLFFLFKPETGHPLVHELMSDHSLATMIAAAFAAVVAAPIYEETIFRLTFQGWLERREMLSRPVIAHDPPPPLVEREHGEQVVDPQRDLLASDGPAAAAAHTTYTYAAPTWLPIIVSGVLFGLAHSGHGVAPVPLMLLGAMLGYVYRQTHRIMPCIVCHALFNGFTFVLLSLQFAA
jgi:membrane protease YdiL (CAAX protease family)